MEPEPRTVILFGATNAKDLCGLEYEQQGWHFVPAPTLATADVVLANTNSIRVGLWAHDAPRLEEHLSGLAMLRTKHRLVQWLALVPRGMEDGRLTACIAHHCFDYLTVPIEHDRLFACMGHAYGMARLLEQTVQHAQRFPEEEQMVGTSECMQQLFRSIRKVALSDAPVFISGESGTGKELTARAIHERSTRAARGFVAVDCASIAPTLVHSELFGYEKGAFTGATQRKLGRIEVAEGGTLFLDEIGDLPLDLQGSLLRFLQESTVQRVGSTRPIEVDVRVVAATHIDLEQAVKDGRFREDLYYRLNVLRIQVPALRERGGDVEVLARHFLMHFLKGSKQNIRGYTTQALDAMRQYAWPGNIRELVNKVRRAIVMCDGPWITPQDLHLDHRASQVTEVVQLDAARERAERNAINEAIRICGNNHSAAARMLGVSRVTLYRLLEKHRTVERRLN
jgi:DNA-binding NtrC family response regulator